MAAPRVRDLLEEAILEGDLKPGERLRAEALAQRFGTSRTPIREALLQLEAQGLVDVEPNRGAVVRSFDRDDLSDLYQLRALLEPRAAALATPRISEQDIEALHALCDAEDHMAANEAFHRIILEAAGSPRLLDAMRAATGIPRTFRSVFWHDERQREESLMCHRRLVAAFNARDAELAEAVMRMHILGAIAFLEETWPTNR
ncbi:GntR family transcriptional regulator [Solirubrobacter taibaiensis]|nr:GntR family transcriptional regulator [Solirubrobacter taibaiensis]